jgi:hypothetical protein
MRVASDLVRFHHCTCLAIHWSGWTAHAGKRLFFLATAQFKALRQSQCREGPQPPLGPANCIPAIIAIAALDLAEGKLQQAILA